jgi:hypothetical protein
VLLGVVILCLAVWLVLELGHRLQQQRRCQAFVADLRDFAGAFQQYSRLSPALRAAAAAGDSMPPNLAALLKETNWPKGSPFGGEYAYLESFPRGTPRPAVGITAFSPHFPLQVTRAELLMVDRLIDDGNLDTGSFRTGFNGWPVYQLPEKS